MKKPLGYFDEKIRSVFQEESVYKDDSVRSIFEGRKLPSFIKDWLIKRFSEGDKINKEGILAFLERHMPVGDIKMELIKNPFRSITVIARVLIEADIKRGLVRFSIPDMGIRRDEGIVSQRLVDEGIIHSQGEQWGICKLVYILEEKSGYVQLEEFRPFNPYKVDLDYYIEARSEFTTEEWIDLLIRSMEINPESLTIDQKITYLCRLTVFVEPNLNLIELAPKGTGKSYVFSNLSKYGLLISGGNVSRARLFYNKHSEQVGAVVKYDYIAFDEVQTISFSDENEIRGILKAYLENGTFNMENYRGKAHAGFVLLGNIPLSEDRIPIYDAYFAHLPEVFQESALIDRFHGFIEGWKLPRFNESLKVKGYALNVEYFSDILHSLRERGEYAGYLSDLLEVPRKSDTRDKRAIFKLTTALLKLIFPNVVKEEVDKEDIRRFCLEPAIHLRRKIKEQLHIMDREYSKDVPSIEIR